MTGREVFINCPFTADYDIKFKAIVFTVIRAGFNPRCAREEDDSSENRFEKISRIVADCGLGIHDISMTELDAGTGLPRFNMPLELGLFLGARRFGGSDQRRKKCLVLDREQYRYQKFISDIAGQDIHSDHGDIKVAIREVATWLRDVGRDPKVPGGVAIAREFQRFQEAVPAICAQASLDPSELTFKDYVHMAAEWIAADSAAR